MGALFSTSYLPPISYIVHIHKYSNVYIEHFETYSKQTFRNRCEIYSANGKLSLSVPVTKTNGNNTQTKDIKICNAQAWQRIHWNAICSAYNKSPYFLYYRDYFEPIYFKEYEFLIDLNYDLLKVILQILRSNTIQLTTTDYIKHYPDFEDLRQYFDSKLINEEYYFNPYYQVFDNKFGFYPNLSIIDLIFNMGNQSIVYLNCIYKKSSDQNL